MKKLPIPTLGGVDRAAANRSVLTHAGCGGEWTIVGQEFVSDDHPSVDVYRCKECGEQTLQPSSLELDKVFQEITEG